MLQTYFVYILECGNGSYYTGYTTDLIKRFQKHRAGTASKYTRSFPPKRVAAHWIIESASSSRARRLEAAIKKLSKAKKSQLILEPALIDSLKN